MAFVGPEFVVNTTTENGQGFSNQAILSDNRAMVVWSSALESPDGESFEVRARFLDADGTPIGSDFVVNTTTNPDSNPPSVTALADGSAFVSWVWHTPGTDEFDIRGRVIHAGGTGGPDFIVNTTTANAQIGPAAATLADGHVLITWSSDESDGSGTDPYPLDVRGRILDSHGMPIGADFIVNADRAGDQLGATVTALPDGRALVIWTAISPDAGVSGVMGRFVNSDGTSSTADFHVLPDSGQSQNGASATVLADGRIFVTWTEQEAGSFLNDVHGRILNADGSVSVSDVIVNASNVAYANSPSVTALPDGRALVVWEATDFTPGSTNDIHGHIVNADGSISGPDFVVNSIKGPVDSLAHLITQPDGEVLATWTAFVPAPVNSDDIHGSILSFDTITDGTPGNDRLIGTADNDIIHGLAGNDDIQGSLGNDVLYGDAGNDLLHGDAGNDFLFGGDGDDRLWGNYGNDTFVGGKGADAFGGGAGIDTVRYETSPAAVHIDLTLNTASGGDANGDSFSSIETVIGSRFDDTLIGDGAANTLSGGSGRDILDGRDGNDTLDGGEGNDALTGGAGNDVLHGGAGNDQLWGNAGDDILAGGPGADVLAGGAGNDTADYSTSSAGVNVNLAAGTARGGDAEGDTLSSIENLIGSATIDLLTGNSGDNHISGGSGDDLIDDGGGGNDVLDGGTGNDTLTGGLGADILIGGAGAGNFVFKTIQDSLPNAADQIVDFSSTEADRIDLSAIDANSKLAGNQAFAYVGAAAFTHTAGELRFADHLLEGDVDGNGTADFAIQIHTTTLKASDFIL
jgi:serralysin